MAGNFMCFFCRDINNNNTNKRNRKTKQRKKYVVEKSKVLYSKSNFNLDRMAKRRHFFLSVCGQNEIAFHTKPNGLRATDT